jgi:hypothetical protein
MIRVIAAAIVAVACIGQAEACNRARPDPMDLSCPQSVFLAPFHTQQYWIGVGHLERLTTLHNCAYGPPLIRPSPRDCALAAQAEGSSPYRQGGR